MKQEWLVGYDFPFMHSFHALTVKNA